MSSDQVDVQGNRLADAALRALCSIASFYQIQSNPLTLARELALGDRKARPKILFEPLILSAEGSYR